MFEIILFWIFKSHFRKTDIGKLKAARRDELREECERLVAKTQSNKSNWWNITRSFNWMSIMHNHSLPKEYLATWNRTETTRKVVRELNISYFGLAFQPRSIWHTYVCEVCLQPRLDAAIGYWLFPGDFRQIQRDFPESLQRSGKFFIKLPYTHFEGGQTKFYIHWREVKINYVTRQPRGQ